VGAGEAEAASPLGNKERKGGKRKRERGARGGGCPSNVQSRSTHCCS